MAHRSSGRPGKAAISRYTPKGPLTCDSHASTSQANPPAFSYTGRSNGCLSISCGRMRLIVASLSMLGCSSS